MDLSRYMPNHLLLRVNLKFVFIFNELVAIEFI